MMSTFADLSGQRAFVTGSSTGIGRAIARELARAGASVLFHCRRSQFQAQEAADECRALYKVPTGVLQGDMGDPAQIAALCDQAWSQWSGLDIVVHNAGVDLLTGPAARLDYAAKLQQLLDIDVRGTLLLCHDLGARMQAAGKGTLLTIGWDQADRGMEGASGELFATAKNAVMGFTRSLSVSLAPQVRVNCIAPGWIRTAWGETAGDTWQERVRRETPLQRWGTPQDLANLARFLVSREASYITGQVINANGGAVR